MIALKLTSTLIFTALLASCAAKVPVSETAPAATPARAAAEPQMPSRADLVTGKFHCELGNRAEVRAEPKHPNAIKLLWKGRSYQLQGVATSSGALRYEDTASGLVWIQIPAKSILLNSKAGKQLANECKTR